MKYLKEAAKIAMKNRINYGDKNYHLGCIAIRQDGSLVSSVNVRTYDRNITAHAEARTLMKAGKGATLFVARAMVDGSWGMAKPCPLCQKLIRNLKVKKVYYTVSIGEYGVWIP